MGVIPLLDALDLMHQESTCYPCFNTRSKQNFRDSCSRSAFNGYNLGIVVLGGKMGYEGQCKQICVGHGLTTSINCGIHISTTQNAREIVVCGTIIIQRYNIYSHGIGTANVHVRA